MLTGDKKYVVAAKDQLFAMCDDWCEWHRVPLHKPEHKSDMFTGITLWAAALGYDWFYHDLTPEEREHSSKFKMHRIPFTSMDLGLFKDPAEKR